MANFTSTHTGSVVDAAVTKITATSSSATELNILDGVTATTAELNILDGVTATTAEINILDGVTATAAEINILDGVTSTAAELNILDGVTSTAAELNVLDGYTGSVTELNYLDTLHATGVTSTEFDYLDGVTSNIQTQLDAKIEATLTSEQVQDIVGAMFSSNTESGITVSYEDGDGTIDLTVATQSDNNFTTTLLNKLNAIEASADVTDTANVTSSGALMDSEVSNLSFVKSLTKGISDGNVLTANDAVADNDFLRIDGTEVEGRTAAEVRSDLNVEDGATADQTASEIKTLVGNASDSNVFTDADHSKLDGIEASADVTDATNVTAAGALMDSELTSIADVKALDQSVVSGATPTFTTTNFTDASNKRFMTDAQETKLDSVESNATADQTDEEIQDVVGAMFSSNTETGITATYQDGDGTIDLVVGTLNQDTTGTAAKVTVSDSTANTNFPVVFHDESNALLDDTGALRYNPSTGELLVPKLTVAGTTTQVDTVTMEAANAIIFEGATADAHETTLSIVDPTADHTQYLINQGGYIPVLAAATTTAITSTPAELNILDGVTSTAAELNILDGVTATAAELNIMDGVTATTAELNYTDGVTSNIQTQLDATLDTAGTGIDISSTTVSVDVSDFMANGADNRVLTATGTDAMNAEANLTFDGNHLDITSGHLVLPYGEINDSGTDLNIVGTNAVTLGTESGTALTFANASLAAVFADDVKLAATKKLYLDGGSHTYIVESATDIMDFYAGGVHMLRLDETNNTVHIPQDSGDAVFTVGAGSDFQLYIDSDDVVMRNQTQDKDMKFIVNDGGSNVTAMKIDASEVARVQFQNDNQVVAIGASDDLQFYHDGTNNVINTVTQDADLYFVVNDGGSTLNAIHIDASETARVKLPNDNQRLTIGASDDLQLSHESNNNYIATYSGNLILEQTVDDADIIFNCDDGSGGTTAYLTIDGSATLVNFDKASRHMDNTKLYLGAGLDLELYHTGSDSYIANTTGDLYIQNEVDDKDIIFRTDDGSGGVTPYITLDGSATSISLSQNTYLPDDKKLYIGSHSDQYIYYDGTNNQGFFRATTGDIVIRVEENDHDLILQCDDGSGGVAAYLTLDGSITTTTFNQNARVVDSKKMSVGNADDASFYHDGTDTYFENGTGNFYIRNLVDDGDLIFQGDNGSGGNATYLTLDGSAAKMVADKSMLFKDSQALQVGDAGDASFFHNGTYTNLTNSTGSFYIDNNEADTDIIFRNDDGSGGVTPYITLDGSSPQTILHKNTVVVDSYYLGAGDDTDLRIYHNGTDSYMDNTAGDLYIKNSVDDKDIIFQSDDGSGGVTAYLTLDGSATLTAVHKDMRFDDSEQLQVGAGADAKFYHDGSNTYLDNTGANNFIIQQSGDDQDLVFRCDDESGGVASYITLDGSAGHLNLTPPNNVGIGETSPASDLVVRTDTSGGRGGEITILNYATNAVGNEAALNFGLEASTYNADNGNAQIKARVNASDAATDMIFSTWNGSAFGERARISSAGNVGIGTVSPSAKLDIVATGDEGLEVTGGSGYLSAFFQTDFDTVAKFYSSDGTAQIELADNSSSSGYNTIGVQGNGAMFFKVNNSERMRIDSSGRLVVGATAAIATTAGTGASQVLGTGNSDTVFTIGRFSNNTGVGNINFLKSRNGTIGSNTIVQDDDGLGAITWAADDGTDFVSHAAKIDARIDGTPGANDTPGRLSFYTTADGSDSAVERVRIDSAGNMRFSDNASNPSASSNMAFIFNDGGEMKVLDELGNTTTISPHNFELIPEGASEDMAWSHHSVKGNKTVNVDMMKLARLVEELTGEKLVYTEET